MDKCPHCGSTEPFKYKATLVTLRMGQWGEKVDEEVSVESSTFAKTVTCTECGKRVNFDLAHEKAVEQSVEPTRSSGGKMAEYVVKFPRVEKPA